MTPTEKRALRAEHTPGPWRWEDSYDCGKHLKHKSMGLDADCENIRDGRMVLIAANGKVVLEEWAEYAGDAGLTVSREDALLIARAPELLQQVATLSEGLRAMYDFDCEACQSRDCAQKALQSLEVKS